ncbi:MAG: PhnD/SsuA/transferrin family substrate-binding protein [Deltaproteobacteria bacterium]|nr:PhnD/SsuA/transferrin family substrate-binding protein [Deltaproteobacteria bacterium]
MAPARWILWFACAVLSATALLGDSAFAASPAGANDPKMIVLYDPDANHQALGDITAAFNAYAATSEARFTLQPVESRTAFETLLTEQRPPFAIVSSSTLRAPWGREFGLNPLLVPSSKGDVFYRKALVSNVARLLTSLKGVSTAVAVIDVDPKAAALDALAPLTEAGFETEGAIVVPVTKDIDALLALAFKQVDAALVTTKSMDVLTRVNPALSKLLKVTKETAPLLRPPLCSVGTNAGPEDIVAVMQLFAQMNQTDAGQRLMSLLGFDAWTPYKKSMEP